MASAVCDRNAAIETCDEAYDYREVFSDLNFDLTHFNTTLTYLTLFNAAQRNFDLLDTFSRNFNLLDAF